MRFIVLLLLTLAFANIGCAAEKASRPVGIKPFRKPGQPYAIGTPKPRPTPRSAGTPEVTTQNFKRLNKSLGEWSGTVRGNGEVHLNLRILRAGKVESVRYIGFVPLKNKSSTFHFRSPIPTGKDWSWRIVAFTADGLYG